MTLSTAYPPSNIIVDSNGNIVFNDDLKWDNINKSLNVAGKFAHQPFEQLTTVGQSIGATDTIILFDNNSSDPIWDVNTGIITAKVEVLGGPAEIELHIDKTGGGGTVAVLQLWREVSTDGGSTFTPVANTLRKIDITNDGDGSIFFAASASAVVPAGVKFKVLAKNIGTGTLALSSPTGTNSDAEALTGFSAKLTIG